MNLQSFIDTCLPHIEQYRDDLLVHTRNELLEHPGVPFIHISRAWGAQLALLHAADSPFWPARGEKVPYLFGTADREHILDGTLATIKYPWDRIRLVHYFDGICLREVTIQRAIEIATAYQRRVLDTWRGATHRKAA